jgi:transposase
MNPAGIDVGSKELVAALKLKGASQAIKTFENTADGIQALVRHLSKRGAVRVCLEATGTYPFDAAMALSEAQGVEVMVVNPKASKHFAAALMARNKNDRVDAEGLACFGERMEFVPWQKPSPGRWQLRCVARRVAALKAQKAQAKNQLHALRATAETPAFVLQDVEEFIQELEKRIAKLQGGAVDLIRRQDDLAALFGLLVSVKGIAEASAVQILGELGVLPADMTAKEWVAHAGLDPREFSSATRVHKKTRITQAGNRYIRLALYMPALSAKQHEKPVKAYYRHLIDDNGLKKMQAVCAVMRKLLHAIHAMFKTRQTFDGSTFYALADAAAA